MMLGGFSQIRFLWSFGQWEEWGTMSVVVVRRDPNPPYPPTTHTVPCHHTHCSLPPYTPYHTPYILYHATIHTIPCHRTHCTLPPYKPYYTLHHAYTPHCAPCAFTYYTLDSDPQHTLQITHRALDPLSPIECYKQPTLP